MSTLLSLGAQLPAAPPFATTIPTDSQTSPAWVELTRVPGVPLEVRACVEVQQDRQRRGLRRARAVGHAVVGRDRKAHDLPDDDLAVLHDGLGATRADIDCAWVAGGVHAGEIGYRWGDPTGPDPSRCVTLFERTGVRPRFILPTWGW
jgi:hypothetical protein